MSIVGSALRRQIDLPGPVAVWVLTAHAIGLSNPPGNFPYETMEYPPLEELIAPYKVFLRHGDFYDKFNFNRDKGRDAATLGDALAMEVINRYPVAAKAKLGPDLPPDMDESLRRIANIGPVLVTPLRIERQIKLDARP